MSGHPFSEGEQICPTPWGLLNDASEEREAFLLTLVRSNDASLCLGPIDGLLLLALLLEQTLSHLPHRSQGAGWVSFLYHLLLQVEKYNSTGLPPITCPAC